MKPTLLSHFFKSYWSLAAFVLSTNFVSYILFKKQWKGYDLLTFQIWFWITMTILMGVIIYSIFDYRKTYRNEK